MTNREAINLLEEVRVLDDSIYAYNKAYSDALEMALTALEAEEAWYESHEYPHKEQWIPVTERLPEYGDKVLVTFRNKYIDRTTIGVSYCYVQKEGFFSDRPFDYAAVAWMPLPEPWEGEEDE